ncbi:hypothetical protein WMY93_001760 [Mugilogobius chulae]|uniref:EEF1A lysine methyltransferase 1 n=1 Tax=Mugilogobius chulae TaxID=88201 RepID=A0AAW0PV34_9GOBI
MIPTKYTYSNGKLAVQVGFAQKRIPGLCDSDQKSIPGLVVSQSSEECPWSRAPHWSRGFQDQKCLSWLSSSGFSDPVIRRVSLVSLLLTRPRGFSVAMSDSEDDVPTLSAHTLAALQEFYAENLALQSSGPEPAEQFSVGAMERTGVACVSAPSVYQKLKQGVVPGSEGVSVVLLEFDRRFASYGDDFIFYDYNRPLELPPHLQEHSFDVVLADPPYLSHECLSKVSQTVQYLSRGKVLLCTGAVMQSSAKELLNVDMCDFLPQHHRNLSNDFRCYTNYPSGLLSARKGPH